MKMYSFFMEKYGPEESPDGRKTRNGKHIYAPYKDTYPTYCKTKLKYRSKFVSLLLDSPKILW